MPSIIQKVKININKTLSTITEASTLLNKQMGDVSQTTVDESKMKDGNIQRIEADVSKRKESLDKLDLTEKVHQLKVSCLDYLRPGIVSHNLIIIIKYGCMTCATVTWPLHWLCEMWLRFYLICMASYPSFVVVVAACCRAQYQIMKEGRLSVTNTIE